MAPINLKDYSWTQSDDSVVITVPFNGCRPASVLNILADDHYIKVNAPPYWFELFLIENIDADHCKCILTDEKIVFHLTKKKLVAWETVEQELSGKEKVELRVQIEDSLRKKEASRNEAKTKAKRENRDFAIQRQIQLDTERRKSIEDRKSSERLKVTKSLEKFKSKNNPSISLNIVTCNPFPIPLVRDRGAIPVKFSAREFPTPSRESTSAHEDEFLNKQLAARKKSGFVTEDLRPEECNPIWLKNKGDYFFKCKNYLGAVSAYSYAINNGAAMPELHSNRSACHLELGNLHKALEDVSTALELLTPPVVSNQSARAKCYARRGIILCRLGLPEKAISEFEAAIKLRPDDSALQTDLKTCKGLIDT